MMFPGKEITEEEYEELEYLVQDLHTYLHVCYKKGGCAPQALHQYSFFLLRCK